MNPAQSLINELGQKISSLKTAQALYSRQLAPEFNTFDYINTDELGLSRILADLLNQQGSHAQKANFLHLFIQHCLPHIYNDVHWQPFIACLEKTKVTIEETTRASETFRRMDIYIQGQVGGDSFGICIENKPYASDQLKQLEDYASELENRRLTQWHIVYLNESENGPCKHSVDKRTLDRWITNNKYSHLRFSDLIDWLKACQSDCQNHSVAEFLAQFIKFIQKQFMGVEDMNESNAVLEAMGQNEASIEASIQISTNVIKLKKQLIKKLIQDIKNGFSKKYDSGEYQLDIQYIGEGKNYEQINFIIPNYSKGYICFEFQGAGFDRPCLGIKFNSAATAKSCILARKMKTVLATSLASEKVSSSSLWPAYYCFTPQNWMTSSETWLMIKSGEMATKILEEMDAVFQVLNDDNLINE